MKLAGIFLASFGVTLASMTLAAPRAPQPAVVVVLDEGRPTVYSPGVWESTVGTRTSWLNPDLLDPADPLTPLRRQLIAENAVVAVNPARYLPEYLPRLQSLIAGATRGLTPGTWQYEQAAVQALLGDAELTRMVNQELIGDLTWVVLPDGSRHQMLIMDVFRPDHAAVDLGLLQGIGMSPLPARHFVADFHNQWLRAHLGIHFDFGRGTYVDAAGVPTPAPELKLVGG